MITLQNFNYLGFTGSGSTYYDAQVVKAGYSKVQSFSNNFSIIRRNDWLNIQDTYVGKDLNGPLVQQYDFQGKTIRFINEAAVITFLKENDQYMLVRWESLQWSVFHVNAWGEQLRQVREQYLSRHNIKPYLFTGKPHRRPRHLVHRYPWQRYYGYPKPSLIKRLRIQLGVLKKCLTSRKRNETL